MSTSALPVKPAYQLPVQAEDQGWLIEQLWADQGVGILGGEPKSCKSILALQIAVAVASGRPCLERFETKATGRVLLYAAEDAPQLVRQRLTSIARASARGLEELDIQVIVAPSLKLDTERDQQRLAQTVEQLEPSLLVLDPLVRLHSRDENSSHEIAPLLGSLRDLQRRFQLAILLVHHARKGAHKMRPGQALRGSSELHAWGDTTLFLRRSKDRLTLLVEHRAAPAPPDLDLELRAQGDTLSLAILETSAAAQTPASPPHDDAEHVTSVLADAQCEMTFTELRAASGIRSQRFGVALKQLKHEGRVARTDTGYRLR